MRIGPMWMVVRGDGAFWAEGGGWANTNTFVPRLYSKYRYAKAALPHIDGNMDESNIVPVVLRVQRAPWRELVKDLF